MVWCLLGKGDLAHWRELARSVAAGEVVQFPGSRRCVRCYLHVATIATGVSGGSGVSNALVEALAASLPIVAIDTPVYRQVLTHGGGLLVPSDDPIAFADAVAGLADDAARRTMLGREAAELARSYDIDVTTAAFSALALPSSSAEQ